MAECSPQWIGIVMHGWMATALRKIKAVSGSESVLTPTRRECTNLKDTWILMRWNGISATKTIPWKYIFWSLKETCRAWYSTSGLWVNHSLQFVKRIRPVFHLNVNMLRERKAQRWKLQQTIFFCMNSISAWARRERETRIYDMWPWTRSLHVVIFQVHAQHSRARKNKRTSIYARCN